MRKKNQVVHDMLVNKDISEIISKKYTKNINDIHSNNLTLGEKVADRLSEFAGSWMFVMSFFTILIIWVVINSVLIVSRPFDPYPFILLNLILSTLAAIQAPIIMMSQNRQKAKDEIRSEHDFETSLKTEIVVEEMLQRLIIIEKNQALIINKIENQLLQNKHL